MDFFAIARRSSLSVMLRLLRFYEECHSYKVTTSFRARWTLNRTEQGGCPKEFYSSEALMYVHYLRNGVVPTSMPGAPFDHPFPCGQGLDRSCA